jgi:hypothetical protein
METRRHPAVSASREHRKKFEQIIVLESRHTSDRSSAKPRAFHKGRDQDIDNRYRTT